MKIKYKILTIVIFTAIILLFNFVTSGEVLAANTEVASSNDIKAEISYYDGLITGKKNVVISVNMKTKNQITKEELIGLYTGNKITNVESNGTSLANTDKVKTGDVAIVQGNIDYTIILAGDANSDGIICDTDDIMTIINDYLGKQQATAEVKIAANLANSDNVLDIDDVMIMINRYLGKVDTLLSNGMPSGSTETITVTPGLTPTTTAKSITEAIAEENYGDYIDLGTNYINDSTGKADWRILYKENDKVIAILKDCLPLSCIPDDLASSLYIDKNYSREGWDIVWYYGLTDVIGGGTWEDACDLIADKLLTSTNWDFLIPNSLKNKGNVFAFGTPTYEMIRDSWNSNSKVNGTLLPGSVEDGTSINDRNLKLYELDNDKVYYLANVVTPKAMVMAGSNPYGLQSVIFTFAGVDYPGGIRPIISLDENIKVNWNDTKNQWELAQD